MEKVSIEERSIGTWKQKQLFWCPFSFSLAGKLACMLSKHAGMNVGMLACMLECLLAFVLACMLADMLACMMACMLFDDREKIHPFYAQAEKYPEYEGSKQQTYGIAEIHPLPTYRIGTPKRELLEAMRIIKDAGGRIQKKKMAEEAEKSNIITVNARKQNFTQARFASLDKNIVQPLVDTWKFVEVEKIGRNRWLKLTEDGNHAAEVLL